MKKQVLFGISLAAVLVVALATVKYFQISSAIAEAESRQQPPASVTSFTAKLDSWPKVYPSVGSLSAVNGTILRAEEPGRVSAVHVKSGSMVEKGQLLLEFNSDAEQAQLVGMSAQLELARLTAKRQRALRKRGSNSQYDLDQAESSLRNLQAEVNRIKAVIERKKIVSPISGMAGIRQANIGEILQQGDAVIAVNSYDSLYVDFSLPQSALENISLGARVDVSIDAFEGEVFEARLTAIDSQIDPLTRNISLQATLDNEKARVRPGMFASVRLFLDQSDKIVSIPESSISFAPYGDSVWIIEPEQKTGAPRAIRSQTVKLGRRIGDQIAVTAGLEVGQEVVSSGIFMMRPGLNVLVNNSVSPGSQLNPTPADT
jgi:membrane fusion protein (multidrug efflux system)